MSVTADHARMTVHAPIQQSICPYGQTRTDASAQVGGQAKTVTETWTSAATVDARTVGHAMITSMRTVALAAPTGRGPTARNQKLHLAELSMSQDSTEAIWLAIGPMSAIR